MIGKLKLNQLSKFDLESRQMNTLKGGKICGCVCAGGCICRGDIDECDRDDGGVGDLDADKNVQVARGGSWNWY